MGILDRFRGNRFELPEDKVEQPSKKTEVEPKAEVPQLTPEMRAFAEVREFSAPLLQEEEKALDKAVEEQI